MPTSQSTAYNFLHRGHGWRKLMPAPHYPECGLAAQKPFKKALS